MVHYLLDILLSSNRQASAGEGRGGRGGEGGESHAKQCGGQMTTALQHWQYLQQWRLGRGRATELPLHYVAMRLTAPTVAGWERDCDNI